MKKPLAISIVVLNWNTSDLLNGALTSIVSTADDMDFEVVVIDNASTDGGLDRVDQKFKNDPRFSFVQNEKNIGWAAINIMLERAQAAYIVTLDPDALLHAGALQELRAFMESNPQAGAATAKLLNPDGTPQLYYRRILTPAMYFFTTPLGRFIDKYLLGLRQWKRYRYEDLDVNRTAEVEQPAWPCLLWRREALGAYIADTDIPFYFVDVDMSKRLYDRGYKIYMVPSAAVTHLKSTSFGKAQDAWRRREYYRSLLVYFRKHYARWTPLLRLLISFDRMLRAVALRIMGREMVR